MTESKFQTVEDLLFRHPGVAALDRDVHRTARSDFPGYDDLHGDRRALLAPYVLARPHRFFNRDAYNAASETIGTSVGPHPVDGWPPEVVTEFFTALTSLRRANGISPDDGRGRHNNDEERRYWLQEQVFPQYAWIAEYIFCGMLGFLVGTAVRNQGGSKNVPRELRGRWEMADKYIGKRVTDAFDPTIRNAVVHGGVRFREYDVLFHDLKKDVAMSCEDAERIADRLLDTCNGIAAAFLYACDLASANSLEAREWQRQAATLALARTPLLEPLSCAVVARAVGPQVEIHGTHRHWHWPHLMVDVVRTLVIAREQFIDSERILVNFSGPRRAPCFFAAERDDIPERSASVASLGSLMQALQKSGLASVEHETAIQALLAKTRFGAYGNWLGHVDRSYAGIDYDLRELRNNSVGWRARFDATVVSRPCPTDVNEEGYPTLRYLNALFCETISRWAIRGERSRPMGANRLRVFRSGIIYVYCEDQRLVDLRGSGLVPNLLFRFELAFGSAVTVPFLGGGIRRIGPYFVAVNPAGRLVMEEIWATGRTSRDLPAH